MHKLIEAGKQLLAVKFVFEFSLVDKFPPVPLLKAYVNDVKQSAKSIRDKGNHSLRAMVTSSCLYSSMKFTYLFCYFMHSFEVSKSAFDIYTNYCFISQNEAAVKEVNALKSVLKYIEDHKLESEYPPKILEKRINEIISKKINKKRSAEDMVHGKMQQQNNRQHKTQQLDGSNLSRSTAVATHTTVQTLANTHSIMQPYQQAHLPNAGLMMLDKNCFYVSSLIRPYGLTSSSNLTVSPCTAPPTATPYMILKPEVSGFSGSNQNIVKYLGNQDIASYSGSTLTVNPYSSSVVGAYTTAGGTIVHPAKLSPKSSNVYMPEPQLPSAYYSTATAYGGEYNVPPQYHPQYYPQ